jgi:hypothetical protein
MDCSDERDSVMNTNVRMLRIEHLSHQFLPVTNDRLPRPEEYTSWLARLSYVENTDNIREIDCT